MISKAVVKTLVDAMQKHGYTMILLVLALDLSFSGMSSANRDIPSWRSINNNISILNLILNSILNQLAIVET
jgi:hypothetical protein